MGQDWEVKKLGDLFEFKNGINFTKHQKGLEGILTIDVLNMYSEDLTVSLNNLYRVNVNPSDGYLLQEGDILFVRSSVKQEGVGWTSMFKNNVNEPVTFCGFIIRARPIKQNFLFPDYIVHYLRSPKARKELIQRASITTITNINQSNLSQVEIPLPPLSEQQRIVEILDEALTGIATIKANTERNLQNARELFQSYLQSIFSNPSDDWEVKTLNQISENLDSKRIPITKNKRKAGIYPYYGASGIVDYVDGYIFDENLLLISEDGANLLARKTPIAFSVSGKIWVNNHAHILRFENLMTQKYIEMFLASIKLDEYITGTAQPKLNQTALNSIKIPYPALSKQQQIVSNSHFEKKRELVLLFNKRTNSL